MKRMTSAVHGISGLLILALAGCGGSGDNALAASIDLAGTVSAPSEPPPNNPFLRLKTSKDCDTHGQAAGPDTGERDAPGP
ncbi:hypothetical protein [Paracidovorax cattleyae]|uniref:Lipoprotein-attachment site-containing protein n=1 Tax=Paracidovorax cattleyae TaxID=80868 RepID=A0A1H0WG43_9BURK|nr:hypothetical protein [Paracidovorax cattleyae]MBF9264739.1 hypothetical protein [Paracidovorax cattleyae]SDP89627.1 hypothetical protein SAMN04489708_13847 [Paracidovorax cattleyae]